MTWRISYNDLIHQMTWRISYNDLVFKPTNGHGVSNFTLHRLEVGYLLMLGSSIVTIIIIVIIIVWS